MINKFDGEYSFLSNFSPHPVQVDFLFPEVNGKEFPTSEHAFQAAKTHNTSEIFKIMNLDTPGKAKRAGAKVTLREGWDDKKNFVMGTILGLKFRQNSELLKKLKETKEHELVEGNTWHDNYWGSCTCDACAKIPKKNILGRLLMAIRDRNYISFYELVK